MVFTKSDTLMVFGIVARIWIWLSTPPTVIGYPPILLMTLPMYAKTRGRCSFFKKTLVLFTWKTMWIFSFV